MLEALRNLVQDVNAASDLPEALQIVVKSVKAEVQSAACSIYLLDRPKHYYHLMACVGFEPSTPQELKIARNKGLVGLVGTQAEPMHIANAPEHPNYLYFAQTGEERYQAFLGAPIIHQKEVLGVLVCQDEVAQPGNTEVEAFLITVCAQLSGIIAHALETSDFSLLQHPYGQQHGHQTRLGTPCAPGVAIGWAHVVYPLSDLDAVPHTQAEDVATESRAFMHALEATRSELNHIAEKMSRALPKEEMAIFEAYMRMLDDTSIGGEVLANIKTGDSAQLALKKVIKKHIRIFEGMEDAYLCERALDIKDLGRRLLSHLQRLDQKKIHYSESTILVGEELSVSALAEVPEGCLVGIISISGSTNSHVAILARSMGIPVIMGAQQLNLSAINEQRTIIDGYHGKILISPTKALEKIYQQLIIEEKELYQGLQTLRDKPAITPDGVPIKLMVNTGLLVDVHEGRDVGADGVGLYRTETAFIVRDYFPTEEEQYTIYRTILSAYAPQPVIMRTLDIGGDKQLPYFPIEEPNPFLGWRGIRVTLDHPELFVVQIRAMLRAAQETQNLKILLPMIMSLAEVLEAKAHIHRVHQSLCRELGDIARPEIGIMIEVPAAIYQAQRLAQHADFFSIGSNDLVQYLLAVDRNNTRVANRYQCLHPSVLFALQQVVTVALANRLPVSVCGEMAGDPVSALLLMAMGVDSLSMNSTAIGPVKWVMRTISSQAAKRLLNDCLSMHDALTIRQHVEHAIEGAGLGGLVRAGK